MARADLTSRVFGRLTAITPSAVKKRLGKVFWVCMCECGNLVTVDGSNLRTGNTKSCGCLKIDVLVASHTVHGMSHTATYSSWEHMRCRCNNPNNQLYGDYGGRGIFVCKRWESFDNFYADMGDRPSKKHSLGRIDNDGPYSPENCKWETPFEQQNNRRNNCLLTHDGKTQTLAEWSREAGIPYGTLRSRMAQHGWSVEKSLMTPLAKSPLLAYNGEALTRLEWSRRLGISEGTITSRLKLGWSVEEALTTPVGQRRVSKVQQNLPESDLIPQGVHV